MPGANFSDDAGQSLKHATGFQIVRQFVQFGGCAVDFQLREYAFNNFQLIGRQRTQALDHLRQSCQRQRINHVIHVSKCHRQRSFPMGNYALPYFDSSPMRWSR